MADLTKAMHVHKKAPFKLRYSSQPEAPIEKVDVNGVPGVFILKNVLTKEECQQFIQATEQLGYTDAPVSTGLNSAVMRKDIRDNERVMWELKKEEIKPIWDRIKKFLPKSFEDWRGKWELVEDCGLNERFRFYRYEFGQSFAKHFDGFFPRSETERSALTFIIYLNEGFEGGETVFYPDRFSSETTVKVNPQRGQALLFWHSGPLRPLHEGAPHFSQGMRKYALRSDVMYRLTESKSK